MVWLAPVADGRLLVPARIDTHVRFGRLVIEATDARSFGNAMRPVALR